MQYVVETDAGFTLQEREDLIIPAYEIGQTVIFKRDGKTVEAEICGYMVDVMLKNHEYEYEICYSTLEGDSVYENEIDQYYPLEET